MSDRVWQDENSFEVATRDTMVDFNVDADRSLTINIDEDAGWGSASQDVYFTLTEEEAKQLAAFLNAKGY